MTHIVLTCSCGAYINASWEDRRNAHEGTLPLIEQFRSDHNACTKQAASRPFVGEAASPNQEKATSE